MRILFTSSAGLGHLHPLVPLMRAAAAAGDEIGVAVPAVGVPKVERLGFPATSVPVPDPAALGRAWANVPPEDPNTYVVVEIFTRLQARAALGATRALVEEFAPDLVVSENSENAGAVAAEAAGVPHLTVGIVAMDADMIDFAVLRPALDELRLAAGVPATGLLPWEGVSRYASAVPPALWHDPQLLPPDWTWFRHEDAEGPVTTPHTASAGGAWPRVYASLGSVAGTQEFAAQAYRGVLAGLGETRADVLFTVGDLDPTVLGPVPANVTVEAYVPQARAMSCDAVVIHAGCGSTVAALARGLPIVAVPIFADQPHNAARVAALGAGVVVDVTRAAQELPSAVATVLADPSYAARSRVVAAEIAARPPASAVLDSYRAMSYA